jgi:deoxycytidylate deaminase
MEEIHVARRCKSKHTVFFQKAAAVAAKSPMTQKHGCVIVYTGSNQPHNSIIAIGYNQYHSYLHHKYSIHAEVQALTQVNKKYKSVLHQCDMYIVRISNGDYLKLSKPCEDCTKAIRSCGLRNVYYSVQ